MVMYICFERNFRLQRSCNEVQRPEFWLSESFVQIHRKIHRKVATYIWSFFLGDIACRRLSCQEGVAAGFGRGSAAQNHGLGGDVRLKSGGHICYCSYCCRSTENGDLARTAKTELSPLCLPWATHMPTGLPWPIPAPS